jgi:carbonic anhydrase
MEQVLKGNGSLLAPPFVEISKWQVLRYQESALALHRKPSIELVQIDWLG